MIKITGGSLRGRHIRTAAGLALRPSSARLRETLFNIIGENLQGSRFLDLCAGSGAIGFEALSRGAGEVFFVDSHPTSISLIKRNAAGLSVSAGFTIIRTDAPRAIGNFRRRGADFDYIFLDPPYDSDVAFRCLLSPDSHAIIRRRGRLFVEHRRGQTWPDRSGWHETDSRVFGETVMTTFSEEEQE